MEGNKTIFIENNESIHLNETWLFLQKDPVKKDKSNLFRSLDEKDLIKNNNYIFISLGRKKTYAGKFKGIQNNYLNFEYNRNIWDVQPGFHIFLETKQVNNNINHDEF